jgi:hypothetical protein
MGWGSTQLNDETLLTHDGGIDGMASNVSFMPQRNLGVVILQNTSPVASAWIARRIWEHVQGKVPSDWARDGVQKEKLYLEEQKKLFPDPELANVEEGLEEFAGYYCNALYGKVKVTANKGALAVVLRDTLGEQQFVLSKDGDFVELGNYSQAKYLKFFTQDQSAGFRWHLEATSPKPVEFLRCQN